MGIANFLERDSRVKKLKSMLESPVYSLDIDKYEEEILLLHKTRMMRSLDKKKFTRDFQTTIIDCILENNQNRTRLAEIHTLCNIKLRKLESHVSRLRSYMLYEYKDKLSKVAKTIKDRDAIVENVLEEGISRREEFRSLIALIDFVIKDIDSSSWDLKSLINVFEIQSERKAVRI